MSSIDKLGQYRTILSADTASEVRWLLSKKRREYFVYSRAFLQRRWYAVAARAVLKPEGRELRGVAYSIYLFYTSYRYFASGGRHFAQFPGIRWPGERFTRALREVRLRIDLLN